MRHRVVRSSSFFSKQRIHEARFCFLMVSSWLNVHGVITMILYGSRHVRRRFEVCYMPKVRWIPHNGHLLFFPRHRCTTFGRHWSACGSFHARISSLGQGGLHVIVASFLACQKLMLSQKSRPFASFIDLYVIMSSDSILFFAICH